MGEHHTNQAAASQFIARWTGKTASELSTAQSFLIELCALIGVAPPTHELDYMFERPITFSHGDGSTSAGRIDCYRQGHFVLEAKKVKASPATKGFDDGLLRARALPSAEGRGPQKQSLPRILETLKALAPAKQKHDIWRGQA
ncbi:type IIL restriction-modification enzyme MmeI [Rhodoferax sp.]|uniref:type IIL restriction-modification enzyme MmeI n=1 Tax=Rhodoferax sp. TaxID=50421 RepID=UPI002ACEADB6|nr:type IIL restriction-modification enzyme MmeI [Rhodoferax sp.]MDZ7918633.1 type IIL restriction-modification enzyme MmeI [Rhodoferax sp.]